MTSTTVRPRVRFAPSPTGFLHMGGARTALFNWLFAAKHGGEFILRIEDTDHKRNREDSARAIVDGMSWLGLHWDEGPFYQSERMELYREWLGRLEQSGHAYRCYCTVEEVDAKREQAQAEKRRYLYDRTCRDRSAPPSADAPYTLRLNMPTEGEVVVDDAVKGRVVVSTDELDDWIVARTDGTPTYNFTVVVDDLDMRISHVIRGEDHLSNTPKQIELYRAFGAELPVFAHVPKVAGLSKRTGAPSIQAYRAMGFLPQAVMNYLARLGWSHGDDELFSEDELVRKFSLEGVGISPSRFDLTKMRWVNQEWIKRTSARELAALMPEYLARVLLCGPNLEEAVNAAPGLTTLPWERLPQIVETLHKRADDLGAMASAALFFFRKPDGYEPKAAKKWLFKGETARQVFQRFLGDEGPASWPQPRFTEVELEPWFRAQSEALEVGLGAVAQPVRLALVGSAVSPPLFECLAIVGQTEAVERVRACLRFLDEQEAA